MHATKHAQGRTARLRSVTHAERAVYLRMQDRLLSTIALLGCAFLIYVFFHWLRDELNPKRTRTPVKPRVPDVVPHARSFLVGSPRRHL